MTRTWQMERHVETIYDTMVEQIANIASYNVASGCEPSYSASGLGVTVGAGSIKHNGVSTTVAGSSVNLVPDATNPLLAWVALDSTGAAVVVHGTAAANPTVPELGDYVEVALVLVEANQTIANACAVKLDKRLLGARQVTGTGGASTAILTASFAGTSTMASVTDLAVTVSASTTYAFRALIHYYASTAQTYSFRFTGPTGSRLFWEYEAFDLTNTGGVTPSAVAAYVYGFGASTPGVIAVHGTIVTSTTAGSLQYQHASSGGSALAKSRLELY